VKKQMAVVAVVLGLAGMTLPGGIPTAGGVEIPLPRITGSVNVHPVPPPLNHDTQPVGLHLGAEFKNRDGSHVPALRSFLTSFPRGISAANEVALPKCGRQTIEDTPKRCGRSLVGKGTAFIEEGNERRTASLSAYVGAWSHQGKKLLVLISPEGGKSLISTLSFAAPQASFTASWSIPKISDGRGSLVKFRLDLRRFVAFRGVQQSWLSAQCPKTGIEAHVEAIFKDEVNAGLGNETFVADRRADCAS
jgi:hypothetical protein